MNTQLPKAEGPFPIRTIAQLTGVNPITLRAWERRYGLIRPLRTAKGHRLYSVEDIHTIRRILELLDQGMGIGQVARLLTGSALSAAPNIPPSFVNDYHAALTRLDETELDRLEAEALGFTQPDALLTQVLLPLLDALAQQQVDNLSAQAHYAILKARVMLMLQQRLRALRPVQPTNEARLLLVSLPPERGGLTALRLAHALALKHHSVHLPPPGLNAAVILELAQGLMPSRIVLILDHPLPAAVRGTQLALLAQGPWPVVAVGAYTAELADDLERLAIPYAQGSIPSLANFVHDQLTDPNPRKDTSHVAA
ncbi:MAG: MerR family transcriptional regulator [Halothiobacillaceae bacterium]